MNPSSQPEIAIKGARTNNLKNISLTIPHNKLIVVTGVSGSGKSSLVFEIIAKEGQRRYFETLPSFARQFMGKLNRPDVDEIEGLSPVIAIGQQATGMNARSTVGTMSDIYDLLRLLYARIGSTSTDMHLTRALFSFNSEVGKCKKCNGIGKTEQIDLDKLIVFPDKTIREGALAPTLPNGYIMYSQVTIDVLNQVCEAEGFSVDVPWNELTESQRTVVLYGSDKIKVPFGKHSLESRLKWTGIKAKPREEGFYKGMIPIMSDILRRDRNANILKYVHAITCEDCNGARLNAVALSVQVHGKSIAEIAKLELNELKKWIVENEWCEIGQSIVGKINRQAVLLEDLGVGHLNLDRSAKTLSASEIQRIRLANQIITPLSDVLYVFDEPSIGLHQEENERLIYHFKQLVNKGNTVIVVEHDLDTIASADHIIEIGPKSGDNGGELMFNGAFQDFLDCSELNSRSLTYSALTKSKELKKVASEKKVSGVISLLGCKQRNLKNIDVDFQIGKLNVVSGRSGVGKSSLVKDTLLRAVQRHLGGSNNGAPLKIANSVNLDVINKLIFIDHSPIGRTPRSNPATYIGLSDHIRDVFAKLPSSKALGFTKSRFSFNNKGGRCEVCQGAGKTQIGMHFLGAVDLVCGGCSGERFNKETLQVKFENHSISDIYSLSVDEARELFLEHKKVDSSLKLLQEIGLGYLKLGQSSTSLSGGEAQRIKIANQLKKKDTGKTLYIIVEPSIGLHHNDIKLVMRMFDAITKKGNTIVCIEQNEQIIENSDWHLELGPKGGSSGGELIYQGLPKCSKSKNYESKAKSIVGGNQEICLNGVTTNGLKNVDVVIPKRQLTVVTGLSGSGKSSLVYNTLFAESNARFTESLSTYNRSFLQQNSQAKLVSFSGLGPSVGINRKGRISSRRSTVGTLSGVYDTFRLLYSRVAQHENEVYTAQHFSFNHHLGACPTCEGLGAKRKCNPEELIATEDKSIWDGAIATNKAIAYYADVNGQFMATLKEVAKQKGVNIDLPWKELSSEVKGIILFGTGDELWDVTWEYATKSRTGTQKLTVKWLGLCNYIDEEYQRKLHNKNIKVIEELLHDVPCPSCNGSRLKPELLRTLFLGYNIHQLSQLSISRCYQLLKGAPAQLDTVIAAIAKVVVPSILEVLSAIDDLGIGYLSLDRSISTISGGERQRVTLAGQLSAHLYGVTYVLDEPTIGLDAKQVTSLVKILKRVIANGNTVVVIEHDLFFIKNADYLIEMGPGAGKLGGEVMFQGKFNAIKKAKQTVTYKMLQLSQIAKASQSLREGDVFGVRSARANNLKNIDVNFNAQQLIAITGVSGSGKSSLVKDVIYESWVKKRPENCDSNFGMQQFDDVLLIDQTPLFQSRTATTVSYTGIIEDLKAIFSKLANAKELKLKKADFSYQSKNGKCKTCGGQGQVKTSMDFMSDIWLKCDTCQGMRYNESILSVKFEGYSIGEILKLTVIEAVDLFKKEGVVEKLNILNRVGVGHLLLGQAGDTLSGGEAQRLKLAYSMLQKRKGTTLFLFDEPSTGLHYFDILQLIEVFQTIVAGGDTVLYIEHNEVLITAADQLVVLGPESGENGGELI